MNCNTVPTCFFSAFSVKDIFHERAWLTSSVFSVEVSHCKPWQHCNTTRLMYNRIKDKGRRKWKGGREGEGEGGRMGGQMDKPFFFGGGRGRKGSKKGGWERDREGTKKAWKDGKEGGKERER